ncbi:hypothetical protein ACH5RR_034049 [Cinchona calisaya]|uniref:Uncharacterized protein n=1 Tax=Cinchona calisaya TaxID=153742 RepID=A0ABD2Y9R2_9GENT
MAKVHQSDVPGTSRAKVNGIEVPTQVPVQPIIIPTDSQTKNGGDLSLLINSEVTNKPAMSGDVVLYPLINQVLDPDLKVNQLRNGEYWDFQKLAAGYSQEEKDLIN